MNVTQEKGNEMEGWLLLINSNRFSMHNISKRYFVLEDLHLKSFNSIPSSNNELPIGNIVVDSCIRVNDNGRKNIHNKAFFLFTVYHTLNNKEQLKLGAKSSEEAARWIHSLKIATSKKKCPHKGKNIVHFLDSKWQSSNVDNPRRTQSCSSLDCIPYTSTHMDAFISRINIQSSWNIISYENGLRTFKEGRRGKHHQLSLHPSFMAIGVVDGASEAVFETLMSLGSSRSEWDFCFYKDTLVERLDDHTDIIHKILDKEWLPWGMQPTDLLVQRSWRKDDNGTYVIVYNSVIHKKCPTKSKYIRASLRSGGYIITPTNQGKQSVVRHMLAIDWKSWRSKFLSSRSITINMLERVAALRELFKEKSESNDTHSYEELFTNLQEPETMADNEKNQFKDEAQRWTSATSASLSNLDYESDSFFDVLEPAATAKSSESDLECLQHRIIQRKSQDLSAQKKGEKVEEGGRVGDMSCKYGSTLPMDSSYKSPCSCAEADPSSFTIRAQNYLRNQQKVKAKETMMQLVGADWLKSDKREDELARRPGGIVQKYAAQGGSEFFIVINMQVPGPTTYNLALYYMTRAPLEENKLLQRFVNGDDAFRNSRFKLTPYISKGSWIVKQSVKRKPCLLCKALEVKYFRGKNYLELDVDIGSSKVARSVANLVLGYVNSLVIELAFLIQANTEEELPECLLGTCRLNHLDVAKAVSLIDDGRIETKNSCWPNLDIGRPVMSLT